MRLCFHLGSGKQSGSTLLEHEPETGPSSKNINLQDEIQNLTEEACIPEP